MRARWGCTGLDLLAHAGSHAVARPSLGGRQHGFRNLPSLLGAVELLHNLQRKLETCARALARDDVTVNHSLRICPVRHHVLELRVRVASGVLGEEPVRGEDYRRACAHSCRHLFLLRLRLQEGDERLAIAQTLCAWHAARAGDGVPLLVLALLDGTIGQDRQPTRHLDLQLARDARYGHLGTRPHQRVLDAGRLDLLRIISNRHEDLEPLCHGAICLGRGSRQ
mmetsp:Transcript_112974/g.360863  ORF Transcript_112974/g.360863 Transcript_112974/m.360863 type:complete len:224 (+) Transcript_112974:186-857(+)